MIQKTFTVNVYNIQTLNSKSVMTLIREIGIIFLVCHNTKTDHVQNIDEDDDDGTRATIYEAEAGVVGDVALGFVSTVLACKC